MFYDYMLKFSSESECNQVLFNETIWDDKPVFIPKYTAVDIIGTMYNFDENPEVAPTPIDGWHANVRHNKPAPELEIYQVFPVTPFRVWA